MEKAIEARYSKINYLIKCLQGETNPGLIDVHSVPTAFCVGTKVSINGKTIRIGKKEYCVYDINRVTINIEGSMEIYDTDNKKICGTLYLNVGAKNIELFCIWVRNNSIQVEVKSGKGELFFQYFFLGMTVLMIILIKVLKDYFN